MEGNTNIVSRVHRSTIVGLVHLRLRAGTTGKICITTNRCKRGSSSGEVVVRKVVAKAMRTRMAMTTARVEG